MPGPCDGCISGCCRGYHVVLTGGDAFRIARGLALPPNDFCELRWLGEEQGRYRILLNGLPGAEPRYYRLALRRLPGDHPRYEKRCNFLLTVGERGRCGIYDLRPAVCRTYPTGLGDDGAVHLEAGGQYCPEPWSLERIDVPAFRLRHQHRDRQIALWDALVDGWNARLRADAEAVGHSVFYRFLLDAYTDIAARAPSLLAADEPFAPVDVAAAAAAALRAIGVSEASP